MPIPSRRWLHLDDVAALVRDELQELQQLARMVGDARSQHEEASGARQPVPHHRHEQRRVDVAAGEQCAHIARAADLPCEQRGDRGRAGTFDDELRALEQQRDRLGDLLVVDVDDLVEQLVEDRHRQLTRMLDGDAVGDRPWPSRPACTPTRRTPGRSARSAIAIPAASPPPPIGRTNVCASGSCSASSSPIVPWPAITALVLERVHEGRAGLLGARHRLGERVVEHRPGEHRLGAVVARRLDLRHRRVLRHEHGRGDAELARRPRDGLPVVAGARGDHAGRPLARRRGRVSLLTAPRILNEPVRCRFSAFSQTRRRRGRESVSDP